MEKNNTKVLPKIDAPPLDNRTGSHHEEKPSSSVSLGKILENHDKNLSHDLVKETEAEGSKVLPSKDEPDVATEEDDEEFILRLQSSDEETFEDAIELDADVKKTTAVHMPEKYFSDIESSDDSQVYEPKSLLDGTGCELIGDPVDTEGGVSSLKEKIPSREAVTGIELEFEPVESDEEDFEESPSLEALTTLPKDILPKHAPASEVEDVSDEVEDGRISTTPLRDEYEFASQQYIDVKKKADELVRFFQKQEVAQPKENKGDKEKKKPADQEEVDQLKAFAEEKEVDKEKKVDQHKDQAKSVGDAKKAVDQEKSDDQMEVEKEQELLSSPVSSQPTVSDVEEADAGTASPKGIDYPTTELGEHQLDVPELLKVVKEFAVGDTSCKNTRKVDDDGTNKKIVTTVEEREDESAAQARISAKRKALLDDWDEELSNSPKRNKDDEYLAVIAEELNELPEELELPLEDGVSHELQDCISESVGAAIEIQTTPVTEDERIKSGTESKSPPPEVEDTEKPSAEKTGIEDDVAVAIEAEAETKEVGVVLKKAEADKQIEKETASEESVHNDKETISDDGTVSQISDESEAIAEVIEDSEELQEIPEKSSDKPRTLEQNKSALINDEKSQTLPDESEEVPIGKDKSVKETEEQKHSDVKTDDEPNICSPGSSKAAETLETPNKAEEVVECPSAAEVPPEEKPSQEKVPTEIPGESLATKNADKDTDDLIENREYVEITEKPLSKEENSIEATTSTEKVFEAAEKSAERTDSSTEDVESQKAAEELTENSEKSAHNEPDEAPKNENDSVDSSVKESLAVDETEISAALKKTVDEPKLTDTTDLTTVVTAKSDSMIASSTIETVKTKPSEPDIIQIDDDDADHKESEKKQADIDTNNEEAKSTEENLNEEDVAADDLSKEDAGTSEKATQSKEDKQQLEAVTDMERGAVSVATPSEVSNILEEETTRKDDDVEMLEIIETIHTEEPSNAASKSNEDQSSKDDTTMKPSESVSVQDDEEPLLMIDTAHKDDNEYNDMDTETEQTATSAQTTDSSSDGSLEVFYDKECLNYDCKHGSKNFYRATLFSLNYYKISKKRSKTQFACEECYDRALDSYEEMCRTLKQKQPLLHGATFKTQEYVEIIDSSDEEESDGTGEKFKDENALPKESIELLEAELEGAIRKVMHNVEIQNQLSWTKQILQQRLNNLEEDAEYVSEQLRVLQKKTDNMHNSLYQCPKIKIRQLTPLDLNSGRTYNPETESTIPPVGEVLRPSIRLNDTYYAVKNKAIASWVPCRVIEAIDGYLPHAKNLKHYKIKFLKSKYPMLKTVSAMHMAFFNPPKVRLPIGTRVIAYFDATSLSRGKEKMQIPSAFYPGIIAEPLKQTNRFRYLVFYDDGYFQYVYHKDVRLVCSASEQVWEDVHHQSREFIHNYLTQYAVNRPMVQTQKGQSMLVDYNGKWIYARVIDVDCSLVQMLYEGQSRSEWIYRGSTRLGPVYKESNNLVKNQWGASRISRRTEPFIRYINGDDSSSSSHQTHESHQAKPGEVRSVAKKSVSRTDTSHSSQPVPAVRHLNNSTIFVDDDNKPKGKVVYYTARKNLPPRDYVSHICSPTCPFTITHNLLYYSPLAKPLLSGWERQVFRQKSKKFIVYRGPCGKRMRSMEELHRYLRVTENDLNVDNFDFSPETNCLAEYVIESCIVQKKDISNGKEKMPIPCVNYYDNTMPPDCVYSSRRIPTEGVPLNLNKEFLVGCDCEDDCSDKSKCSCWELTYAGAKYGMPNVPNEMVGYQYKRLYEHVPTGIYECNSRCKCKANCINRVVQQPLQSKLQVFKTSNRGWGLRCINDVPRGSFICIYAGHLLTEQKANEGGLDAGDEYFAELDYIEVAEQIKEGYESDVIEPDEDEELYNPEKEDDDDDEFVAPSESHHNKAFNTRLRARRSTSTKSSTDAEHDSQERQVMSFEPSKLMGQPDHSSSEKQTIRKLFGRDEACYIMDAKITGNLGRYFNHSCSPNLFVQNVFVDTHDLRFPWVAFFAFTHIRAGTELTWNYNYEVGVVPGKVLYCQCGAPNCRQRLL